MAPRCIITFLGLALLFPAVAAGAHREKAIPLTSGWEFHRGDPAPDIGEEPLDPAVIRAMAHWHKAADIFMTTRDSDRGFIWFRTRLPDDIDENQTLFLPPCVMSYQVYLNDLLIARYGTVGVPAGRSFPGLTWQIVPLGTRARGGQLHLRVFSDVSSIGFFRTPIIGTEAGHLRRLTGEGIPHLILGSFYLLFAAVALLLFFTRSRERLFLGFAILSAGLALYTIVHTEAVILLLDAPLVWTITWLISLTCIPVGGMLFFREQAPEGYRRMFTLFLGVFILYALASIPIIVARPFNPLHIRPPLYALYLAAFAAILAVSIRESWRGDRDAQIVLAGFTAITLGAVFDTIRAITHRQLPWLPPFSAGMVLFTLSLITVIARRNIRASRELERYHRRLEELNTARQIQQSILPAGNPQVEGLLVDALYAPHAEVGGDYYDFHTDHGRGLGVLIADVSGHGVPAAIIASMMRMAFASLDADRRDPARLMGRLRDLLTVPCRDRFITACYAYIDLTERRISVANAGHPPLLIIGRDGGEPREINPRGRLINTISQADYECATEPLASGDRIIFYTDGVTECMDQRQRFFGLTSLVHIADQCRGQAIATFLNDVNEALNRWSRRGAVPDDDVTIVVIDVN